MLRSRVSSETDGPECSLSRRARSPTLRTRHERPLETICLGLVALSTARSELSLVGPDPPHAMWFQRCRCIAFAMQRVRWATGACGSNEEACQIVNTRSYKEAVISERSTSDAFVRTSPSQFCGQGAG